MVLTLIAAHDPHVWWVQLLVYVTVAITVASGAVYFLNFRKSIDEARERLVRERIAAAGRDLTPSRR
jgi:hypothetical protein